METQQISKAQVWTGRIMSGLVILFMLFDGIFKFVAPDDLMKESVAQLGYQLHHAPILGTLALICPVLYIIPRTAILGAVLLTGYYGGAIATHVRVDNPLFSHTLFPIYLAILMWGGLWLRSVALRGLVAGNLRRQTV